ncbi:hypothetical protein ALT1644_60030 [Alteromonas macleodii]
MHGLHWRVHDERACCLLIYFVSFVSYLSGLGKLDERRGKAFALLLYTNECGVILTYATLQFNGF